MCHSSALTISDALLRLVNEFLRPRPRPFVHGCLDSPEAPTIILMCVGSTGLALGSTIYVECAGKVTGGYRAVRNRLSGAGSARRSSGHLAEPG